MKTNGVFELAHETVLPGTQKTIFIPAPHLNTQTKIDIPIHVFHGKKSGPKIFIVSSIHGDELNGIEIIRRVHDRINPKKLTGTLITMPIVNIHGVIIQSRYFSDRRDLNRSFPGRKTGTLAARLAYGVMHQVVRHCDYGIDLHTGAIGHINMPQLRIDSSTPGCKELAFRFGAPIILDARQRSGSLREAASKLDIPVLVYEGGEALRFNELCIRGAVRGIFNVLKHLQMIQLSEKKTQTQSKPVITKTSRWLRAPASGLVVPEQDILARHVKKGQTVAMIHDPFLINPPVKLIAPFEGIVIGQTLRAMATEGDAIFHVASFKKLSGVREYIDEFRELITSDD